MSQDLNHIRLAAGIEIRPPDDTARRVLSKSEVDSLAGALAEDLLAHAGGADQTRLTVSGGLLEPGQLLQPGLPAWVALEQTARTAGAFKPEVVSIGAHRGRLPQRALNPEGGAPDALFLCLPLLLSAPGPISTELETRLEQVLFERAGLRPPALSMIHQATGLEPVHGQLMTAADLFALVRMQLAGAGLDPFWPPVEHALLDPDAAAGFELPAGLQLRWDPDRNRAVLRFVTFNRAGQAPADYALWLRAFRQQVAILDHHRVERVIVDSADPASPPVSGWIVEPAGAQPGPDRALRQLDPEVGLVAFSVRRNGVVCHYHPVEAGAAARLEDHLQSLGVETVISTEALCYDSETLQLTLETE